MSSRPRRSTRRPSTPALLGCWRCLWFAPCMANARCQWCTGRGSLKRTGVAAPVVDGFSLKASPSAGLIEPGATATYRITIGKEGNFNGAVEVSASAVTATSGGKEQTTTLTLLVGGSRILLPVVRK